MAYRYHWKKKYGDIPKGHDLHHVIPKHRGGSDDLSNLVCLSRADHADTHLVDYFLHGYTEDLTAYHLLTEYSSDLARVGWMKGKKRSDYPHWSKPGNKIGAKIHKEEYLNKLRQRRNGYSGHILDLETGIFYDSYREAANVIGMKERTLRAKLDGQNKNTTNFVRLGKEGVALSL